MEQIEFFGIPSPCVGVCEADNRGYCKGCLRSRDERLQWLNFTDAKKVDVIRLCKQRKRRRQLALMKAYKQQVLTARSEANAQFEFDPPQD